VDCSRVLEGLWGFQGEKMDSGSIVEDQWRGGLEGDEKLAVLSTRRQSKLEVLLT
jgi:hypothetical protein